MDLNYENFHKKRLLLESFILNKINGFEIKDKRKSFLMKTIATILFFNKTFMTKFTTTILSKIYVSELPWKPNDPIGACSVLAHEYIHLRQMQGWKGIPFCFLYLFPQILALGAIGAIWNLWFLLFLIFLLPLPSLRAYFEYEAYKMSIASTYWLLKSRANIEYIVENFTTGSYYWMFPFSKYLKKKFGKFFYQLIAQTTNLPTDFIEIKNILEDPHEN